MMPDGRCGSCKGWLFNAEAHRIPGALPVPDRGWGGVSDERGRICVYCASAEFLASVQAAPKPDLWTLQEGYAHGHGDWQAGSPPVPLRTLWSRGGNYVRGYSDGYGEGAYVPAGRSTAGEIRARQP